MSIGSKKTAFIFPGQGSQNISWLASFIQDHARIKECFEEASGYLGYDMLALIQHGSMEKLSQTVYTQPILLTAGVALWRLWKTQGGQDPDWLLGHSLGEYTAYVCAESFEFSDAVKLVSQRGAYMQEAMKGVAGGMGVIIGLSYDAVLAICHQASHRNVVAPSNYNAYDQVVIGGHLNAVNRVMKLAKAKGARLTKRLLVSVPAHCDLMRPAVQPFTAALEAVSCGLPLIPVISNHYAKPLEAVGAIKQSLVAQLYRPIHWIDNINFLLKKGVNCFVECGPNQMLANLVRKITNHPVRVVSFVEYLSLGKA